MPQKNNENVKKENNSSKKKRTKKIKKSTIKKIVTIAVLIAILAVILYFASRTLKPGKTIAEVNGEIITQKELDQKYDQLPDQYKLFITKEDFLDQMINVKLLLQEAEKQGIDITEGEIEIELTNIKGQAPTEEAFAQLLEERNIDMPELKKQIKEQLIINKLLNETVLSKIEISDSKIMDYYNANKDNFETKIGEIRVRHILVAEEDTAKQLLKDLQNGEDFGELAKLHSIDQGSAIHGGDLGFIARGQMVKEFEDASFNLKVGQLSPIVKTQFGYHIIKREANNIPYNEAKEEIRNILLTDLSNNAIEIYINQLKSGAVIIIEGAKKTTDVETFTKTDDIICKEDDKIIVRLFSTTKNSASQWISKTFDDLANEYKEDIIAYHWQLDTGDNTLTDIEEKGIPKEEVEIFQKYNSKNTVPTYVFGCKYVRIGNGYKTLEEEKAEFRMVIERLLSP